MSVGRFLLCLHSHMPYVLSHGKSPHGTDWIFEAAAECYLPLLHTLNQLEQKQVFPHWTLNITPILAEQLDDETFKAGFEEYCEEKIQAALEDQKKLQKEDSLWMVGIASMWQRYYTRSLYQFKHLWDRSICNAFKHFQDIGSIELITCGATHGYFPLLSTEESIYAQVQISIETHTKRFGKPPKGIWLPECAYRPSYEWKSPVGNEKPWIRKSVDQILKECGIEYFFVDSHMIRGGTPLGTYGTHFPQLAALFERSSKLFTPPPEERSEYEHYLTPAGVTCFARDPATTVRVWSSNVGYPGHENYLEFHKQMYPGRLRYWQVSQDKANLGAKQPYNPWDAFQNIYSHAQDFVFTIKDNLIRYKLENNRNGTLVAMYDTELFGHWWWEGPQFLYEVALAMHHDPELQKVTGSEVIEQNPAQSIIHLPEGSWGEGGYHNIWLNPDNYWTWEKLYPAQKKIIECADLYPGTPAEEFVLQAARELLLAEASDWQFLISTWAARDYAEIRFKDHIERFEKLLEIAERIHTTSLITEEDKNYLKFCKEKDSIYQDLTLDYWKKRPNDEYEKKSLYNFKYN